MPMPSSVAPTSRNATKAVYDIGNYVKKQKSVNLSLNINLRDLDGEKTLIGTCDSYDYKPNGERIIPKEFTSAAAFKKYVGEMIDAAYEQIGQ